MELKDMILQTLADLENTPNISNTQSNAQKEQSQKGHPQENLSQKEQSSKETSEPINDEAFLHALREKTLVLFEGLQSPQIRDLETKLNLVINYLQYQLCIIDEKLKK